MSKTIIAYNGEEVAVDDDDYISLSGYKWHISSNGYPVTTTHSYSGGGRRTQHPSMHRMVMRATKNQVVDHINRNKLDCRRSNLRFCSSGENIFNGGIRSDNTSGFRGVRRKRQGWAAEIGYGGKMIHLGSYANKSDALRARKAAEQRLYPSLCA